MTLTIPEDRILRGLGDDADATRVNELLSSEAAIKLETTMAVRTLMWRKRRQS